MKTRFAACFFLGVLVMLPFLLGANEKGCTLPTCTDGQVQCTGNEIQTCQNGAWVNTTDCSASGDTCQNGQCVAPAVCANGTIGTGMCCLSVGDFPNTCPTTPCVCPAGQICNCPIQLVGACGCSSGNSHEVKVCNCPQNMCFDGTQCVTPAVCIDGQTQCSGNEVQTCQNGVWVNTAECSASGETCLNGACVGCRTAADCTGPLPLIACRLCPYGGDECPHWTCQAGVCMIAYCACPTAACPQGQIWDSYLCNCVPGCKTAADCTGALPQLCQLCSDGGYGCAHFICPAGTCQIAYCP